MIRLRCHGVQFHSPADEASFFYFIKQVKAIRLVQGLREDFFLHVQTPVPMKPLKDLIGLFRRYNIDLAELKPLKNKRNAKLFGKARK